MRPFVKATIRKGSFMKRRGLVWTMASIEGRVGAGDGGDAEAAALSSHLNGCTNGRANECTSVGGGIAHVARHMLAARQSAYDGLPRTLLLGCRAGICGTGALTRNDLQDQHYAARAGNFFISPKQALSRQ